MGRALPRYGNIGQCENFLTLGLCLRQAAYNAIVSLSLGRMSVIWASLCPDLLGLFI